MIDLYWIPLGAGGNFVRLNGRVYEGLLAALQRRPRCEIYHSALVILAPGAPVCFEIDGWDPNTGTGWSVLAKGIAHDITDPRGAPTGRIRHWPVRPLAPGSREHWIGVWVSEITGRCFRIQN